jgi:hypothetical protein
MFRLLTQVLLEFLVWKSVERFSVYKKKNRFDDPVYKKNVRELIERNKRFEDTKE